MNAFWSVTMYDGKTQLLIKNPINRYLINSPMLPDMKKNADGSLTLYIQKDSPGQGQGNQLAACAERPDLSGHAPLLAEDGTAFHSSSRRRHLEAAGPREGEVIHCHRWSSPSRVANGQVTFVAAAHQHIVARAPGAISASARAGCCAMCS